MMRVRVIAMILVLLSGAFLFGVANPDKSNPDPATIRVLCYNIHWALGTDGKYDIARIARVIKESGADLVALQEVDVGVKRSGQIHEVQLLEEMTGLDSRFGPTQHYQGGLFGNAVLSRFPILDVEIHPLPYSESDENRTTYPRGCIVVTVQGPDGKPLRIVSTHFQHNVHEDRVAEAEAINELLASGEGEKIRTILAGDMNARPDEEPIRILLEAWENATDDPPSPTAPAVNPRSRIDYIFYRPGGKFKVTRASVIDESVASDHRPVFAEFELKGE